MKKYRLIIFDLDGTLADTSSGILECHRYTNRVMGRPIVDETILKRIIGGPLLKTYQNLFGYSEYDAKQAVQIYREHYAEVGFLRSVLYPGMRECLTDLKEHGYLLAVATLKEEELAKKLLDMLGVSTLFDVIHGMDAEDTLSKGDLLNMCMDELGTSRQDTILIGDSLHDANGAQQAGIGFLGVSYGFGFNQYGEHFDIEMVDNCSEIRDRFMNLEN